MKLFKDKPPLVHRGERIATGPHGELRLAAGGPKYIVQHPLGAWMGYDTRRAMDRASAEAALGHPVLEGRAVWREGDVEQFFDTYTDGRVTIEDAFHQALTWLVA